METTFEHKYKIGQTVWNIMMTAGGIRQVIENEVVGVFPRFYENDEMVIYYNLEKGGSTISRTINEPSIYTKEEDALKVLEGKKSRDGRKDSC